MAIQDFSITFDPNNPDVPKAPVPVDRQFGSAFPSLGSGLTGMGRVMPGIVSNTATNPNPQAGDRTTTVQDESRKKSVGTPMGIADMTADQRFKAADAYANAVDKATGVSSAGAQGIAGMTKRFDTYATNPDVLAMRNAREGLLGSGINLEKNAQGGVTISNTGKFDPIAGAQGSSINMKEGNDIMARANQARGLMIDSMIAANGGGGNGVAILPDQNEAANAEKRQRWALDDMASRMKSAGTSAERAAFGQAMNTMLNNQVQQRGQDMNYAAQMAQQGITVRGQDIGAQSDANRNAVTMRGQDIGANSDANRLSIDQQRLGIQQQDANRAGDRWAIEKGIVQGQAQDAQSVRDARAELTAAINSGDPAKIEAAKEKAVASGIKFDKPNNEFTAVTDANGVNITRTNKDTGAVDIIDGRTGALKASIAAPGSKPDATTQATAIKAQMQAGKITREQAVQQLKALGFN